MDRNSFFNNLANYSKNSLHSNGINLHDSSKIDFYNYIEHHGIKGQKWGVRRYQNPDGSLTEEGKQRYLNPDGSLSDKAPLKIKSAYNRYITQKTQEEAKSGVLYEDDHVYDKNKQAEKLNSAKEKHMYDVNFVDAIQNAENLSDDEINKEYEAYLKNPYKYTQTLEIDGSGKIKNSLSGNKTSKAKEQANKFTQDEKKELLGDETPNKELKEKAKSAFGPKATPEEEAKFWKALAKEYEKGNIKGAPSNSSKSNKPTKEEKQELKAAQKEVQKQLKGGLISNWALLNKAMKEAGITDQKNMTAADWNKVNEEIKKLRNK